MIVVILPNNNDSLLFGRMQMLIKYLVHL